MNSAAPAAAGPYPDKATRISHEEQRTKKKKYIQKCWIFSAVRLPWTSFQITSPQGRCRQNSQATVDWQLAFYTVKCNLFFAVNPICVAFFFWGGGGGMATAC